MSSGLRQRLVTALLLAAVVIVVLFWLPPRAAVISVTVVMLAGAWEWAGFSGWRTPARRADYVVAIGLATVAAWRYTSATGALLPFLRGKAEVQELLPAGRHAEAGQRLREICAGPQADAESWFFLGVILGMQGDAAGAENCFRKALVLMPGFLPARFNLGIALRDQGRFDDARAELEAVVAVQPAYSEACNALGYAYVRLERPADAERWFRSALARNPAFPEALTNLGNVLASQERWSEGAEYYRRALQVAPGYADAALNLGRALVTQGHLEEAIAAYRAAREINKDAGIVQRVLRLFGALALWLPSTPPVRWLQQLESAWRAPLSKCSSRCWQTRAWRFATACRARR